MANTLVLCHRQISDPQPLWALESCGRPEIEQAYRGMMELCRESAEHFLQGEFDVVVLTGTAQNRTDLFEKNWHDLRSIVKNATGPVLWLDSDCLVVSPCDPWHWKQFRLFAPTGFGHPKGMFDVYMNCGVKLFPADMPDHLWDVAGTWDHSYYDHEQERYNHMFWQQSLTDYDQPHMNYQAFELVMPDDVLNFQKRNRVRWGLVEILHYHATRGAQSALAVAHEIWDRVRRGRKVWESALA